MRFLSPVAPGLKKDEVLHLFGSLVSQPKDTQAQFLSKLLSSDPSVITVGDALAALHNHGTPAAHSIDCILKDRSIATQTIVAGTLQRLSERQDLPVLYMRTVLNALTAFPQLTTMVAKTLLPALVTRRVWENWPLWQGFVIACYRTKPLSYEVIVTLPVAQLEQITDPNATNGPGTAKLFNHAMKETAQKEIQALKGQLKNFVTQRRDTATADVLAFLGVARR